MNRSAYQRVPSVLTFKEQVAQSGGWFNSKYRNEIVKNPRYETAAEFYAQKAKTVKQTVKIPVLREANLENLKWTDSVFTGDNKKATAIRTFQAVQRLDQIENSEGRKRSVELETITKRLFPKSTAARLKG